eukprot:397283_1
MRSLLLKSRTKTKRFYQLHFTCKWKVTLKKNERLNSAAPSKPFKVHNKFQTLNADQDIDDEKTIRKMMGHKTHAVSPLSGPNESKEIRSKILSENSPKKIIQFLNSTLLNADITIYTTAIKQCGKLKDIATCEKIMQLMQKRNITPNVYVYSILFHAFNQNNKPYFSDNYLNQMINIHKIKPDVFVLTTLFGGCTKHGNVKRAEKILKMFEQYNVSPNSFTYTELIDTYGQSGNFGKCQQLYDEMVSKNIEQTAPIKTVLMHAYLKSNKIDIALNLKRNFEIEGYKMNEICYIPFVAFYVKPSEYFNPNESLKLFEECKAKNNTKHHSAAMINLKFVAYKKLMEMETNRDKKLEYFELIKTLPNERKLNELTPWNRDTARNVFDAYLIYYNNNFNHPDVIQCFNNLCRYIGYWSVDKTTNKWILDLHGYNYEQAKFALYYLLMRKTDELVSEMGFEWKIICGKQQGSVPTSKVSQKGIKQFVVDRLQNEFKIESKTDLHNAGRIVLNSEHVKQHVDSVQKLVASVS